MVEFTPTSWAEVHELLFESDWDSEISRHRSKQAYRGMTDSRWKMPTSLMRLGGEYWNIEKHLLRNFRKYAHRDVAERDSFWYWLTMGQHHGLPTRLLDWTYSPLVALHFATDNIENMDSDGVVWRVDVDDAHSKLPQDLRSVLNYEGAGVFTVDMLEEFSRKDGPVTYWGNQVNLSDVAALSIRNLPDFDKLAEPEFCIFLEPPSIDDRVVNQFALFSVISDPTISMDRWIEKSGVTSSKVIIPAALKWKIRDRLDQANISERVIFPGLDGISRWLKRHYATK